MFLSGAPKSASVPTARKQNAIKNRKVPTPPKTIFILPDDCVCVFINLSSILILLIMFYGCFIQLYILVLTPIDPCTGNESGIPARPRFFNILQVFIP